MSASMLYVVEERPGGYRAWVYVDGLPLAVGYRSGYTHADAAERVRAAYPEAQEAERPPTAGGWLLITDGR